MSNYMCQLPNHQTEEIVSICLNKTCKQERLCCQICEIEYHNWHLNQLVDFYYMSYFFETKRIHFNQDIFEYNQEQIQVLKQVNDQIIKVLNGINGNIVNLREYIKKISSIKLIKKWESTNHSLNLFNKNIEKAILEEECLINIGKQQKKQTKDQMNQENQSGEYQKIKEKLHSIVKFIEQDIANIFESINNFVNIQRLPNNITQKFIDQVDISQDGTIVVFGSLYSVELFDVKTQQRIQKIKYDLEKIDYMFTLSSNNQYLAIFTDIAMDQLYVQGTKIVTTAIYKVKNNIFWKFKVKSEHNISIIFSEDCQFILTSGDQLEVWSLIHKKKIFAFKTLIISKMIVSTENNVISCLTHDYGYIYIWNSQNRETIVNEHHTDHEIGIDLCTSKNSQIYFSSGEDKIKIWKLVHITNDENQALTLIKIIAAPNQDNLIQQIGQIMLTSDEKYIISKNTKEIMIHEIASGKMIQLLLFQDHSFTLTNSNISKDLNVIVTLTDLGWLFNYQIWTRI